VSVESAADRAAMLADFGVVATWSGVGQVTGIFDAAYIDPLGQFEGSAPVFHAASADLEGIEQGDTLTVDDVVYTVVEVQPDGTGMVLVRLRR
jgi:hypothetical protein